MDKEADVYKMVQNQALETKLEDLKVKKAALEANRRKINDELNQVNIQINAIEETKGMDLVTKIHWLNLETFFRL